MARILFLSIVVLATSSYVSSLSCRRCDEGLCTKPKNCKYGTHKDVCACCNVCAKGPGDTCGGLWRLEGKCGEGFLCDTSNNMEEIYPEEFKEGVCVKDPKLLVKKVSPSNLVGSKGNGRSSGRLRSHYGKAKKVARKHKHKAYGSSIPTEFLALLQRSRPKRSSPFFDSLKRTGGSKPVSTEHAYVVDGNHGGRRKRATTLSGSNRRVGNSKLSATQHSRVVYGNIPQEYRELLKAYYKEKRRGKRATPLAGSHRRVGSSKLSATQHSHVAYGDIPEEYRALLRAYYKEKRRGKRATPLAGSHRRVGSSKLSATEHSHVVYGDIPDEFKELLKAYYKENRRGKRATILSGFQSRT